MIKQFLYLLIKKSDNCPHSHTSLKGGIATSVNQLSDFFSDLC